MSRVLLIAALIGFGLAKYVPASAQEYDSPSYQDGGSDTGYDYNSDYNSDSDSSQENSDSNRQDSGANSAPDQGASSFSTGKSNVHFKVVQGDFWHKGKCRACDRRGSILTKHILFITHKPSTGHQRQSSRHWS